MNLPIVKICGLRTPEALHGSIDAGARYVGFVFFEKSPRNISIDQAYALMQDVPIGVSKVGLFVNQSADALEKYIKLLPFDMLQLHGNEDNEVIATIKSRFGLPVMKAIGVSSASDLEKLERYSEADQFLFDAKAPKNSNLPGGNGINFDWNILKEYQFNKPWMLAGGLTPSNVAEAIKISGAKQIDVSSGVETAPGIKDIEKIKAFMKATENVK